MMLQIDIKSVNHRYLETAIRLPRELSKYEDALKKTVHDRLKRGRVDLYITMERDELTAPSLTVDWITADAYIEASQQLRSKYGFEDELTLDKLLQIPGIITSKPLQGELDETFEQELLSCAEEALEQLAAMRIKEGSSLLDDLSSRLEVLRTLTEAASNYAPQAVQEYAAKLRERIRELLSIELDEGRLAAEVAVMADRANIDEELTRLHSHLTQFADLLRLQEPVGRKLDFLIQEMNREVNTIGSKANMASITAVVIEMKAELEKMREQIQNIE